MASTPQDLATAAKCFESCVPDGLNPALHTYLLAQIAHAVAGTSTDPNVLALLSSCFRCLDGTQAAVQTFLLSQIQSAGGTGGNSTGVGPPSGTAADGSIYIDVNTGAVYYFYSGAWH